MSLPPTGDAAATTVEMRAITVSHGPTEVLHDVDLTLRAGEIHALMGENGAGKSTLINVLAGVTSPASGSIRLDGRPLRLASPAEAQAAGIRAVLQDAPVARHLSIGENVMLGHEPRGRFGIRWGELHAQAHRVLDELGLGEVDTRRRVRSLSPATAQLVAIATDIAEVIGGAVALWILFGVPLIAGAIVDALCDLGIDHSSPEAAAAAEAFRALRPGLRHMLIGSGSGRELVDGVASTVRMEAAGVRPATTAEAAELNAVDVAAVLAARLMPGVHFVAW